MAGASLKIRWDNSLRGGGRVAAITRAIFIVLLYSALLRTGHCQARMRMRRDVISFWGFGLLNNLLYVVILSAAIDLVGAQTPKGLVLLADVLPSFLFKIAAPFFFFRVKYPVRITLMVLLSFAGMLLVAQSSMLALKLLGIVLASTASGIGEITFLQLTHYYNADAIHAWSSGTGGAGLVGSFVFMLMTSWIGTSTRVALLFFSVMPFFIAIIYRFLLPESSAPVLTHSYESLPLHDVDLGEDHQAIQYGNGGRSQPKAVNKGVVERVRPLIVPFIMPLMSVYIAEYVINQGISPTLLFDLANMPMFRQYRDAYVTYGTLYQIGVFISRSSGAFVRIRNLWLLAGLQTLNVALAVLQSLFLVSGSIYPLFIFMVYEGLLGGAAYVSTFMSVSESIPLHEREFAMGAVTMSDSSGVVIAALISMWLEKSLCHYQMNDGRPWCEM